MDPERLCRVFATERHGVIDGRNARSLGMTPGRIKSAVSCGRWRRVGRDRFVIDGVPDSFKQRAAAACLGAVCSHRSAAVLHRLEGIKPRQIEIVSLGSFPLTRTAGSIIVHRTNHLPDDHIVERDGIPVTCLPRTLIDLAGVLGFDVTRRAALSAVDRRLVTPEQLHAQLRCCGRSGRPGTASMRRLLSIMDWDTGFSDSDLEDIAFDLIQGAGLPPPTRLFRVHEQGVFLGELDLAYPQERIGIEVDSFAFHGSKIDFVNDRGRLNRLLAAGWKVLHFVYEDSLRPRRFLSNLRGVLDRE